MKGREQGKVMKPSQVLRLALLVSCLKTVRGIPVDQKDKLFALVSITFEVFLLVFSCTIQTMQRDDKEEGVSSFL